MRGAAEIVTTAWCTSVDRAYKRAKWKAKGGQTCMVWMATMHKNESCEGPWRFTGSAMLCHFKATKKGCAAVAYLACDECGQELNVEIP